MKETAVLYFHQFNTNRGRFCVSPVSIYCIIMFYMAGCAQSSPAVWTKDDRKMYDPANLFFTGTRPIEKKLHDSVVRVHGQLMYNFDESAIHPFISESNIKPLWMHFENLDSILHAFLMKHDQSIVAVTGRLDTAGKMFDRYNYQFSIQDIECIEVVQSVIK